MRIFTRELDLFRSLLIFDTMHLRLPYNMRKLHDGGQAQGKTLRAGENVTRRGNRYAQGKPCLIVDQNLLLNVLDRQRILEVYAQCIH